MVVLIGGAGSSGKTNLANQLLKRYHVNYLSLDHLKMGLIRGGICNFDAFVDDSIIAEFLWPIVSGIIETNIENKQQLIIEGCYLPHEKIAWLKRQYPYEINEIYIIFSASYIKENYQNGILANRNVIEKRFFPETRDIQNLIEEHQLQKQLCIKYDLNYIEIDSNYESRIQEVIKQFHNCMTLVEPNAKS